MPALTMSTVSAQVVGGLLLGSILIGLMWEARNVRTRLDKLEMKLEAMSMTSAAELV
jgi:hypothetical protein